MHNFLTEVTADCTDVLVVKPQKVMPNPGRKNQIVHTFEDGRNAVVAVSNTSIFEVELQWTYVSEEDRSTIFELFHASAKANGSARSFYWLNPVDGYVYTVRFLTPLRTVYKPGSLRSVETVRLRVLGATLGLEYSIDLGAVRLATVDNGAMFFHDTEDFSVYAGASGNTPFKIVFTDSDGLTAEAWCGEVGGGETLGDELVTNGDAETGDITGWTERETTIETFEVNTVSPLEGTYDFHIANSVAVSNASYYQSLACSAGWLIKATSKTKLNEGSAIRTYWTNRNYITGATSLDFYNSSGTQDDSGYFTASEATYVHIGLHANIFDANADAIGSKRVTDIPATGLKLYSAQSGTTQSMGTTDAGFNPNAITKVDIYG